VLDLDEGPLTKADHDELAYRIRVAGSEAIARLESQIKALEERVSALESKVK